LFGKSYNTLRCINFEVEPEVSAKSPNR
jgi:hypothetical protein